MLDKYKQKYRYSMILLRELVITDFKLRYQNSVLGYLWALLRPLFTFAIIYVFFVVVLKIGKGVENWGVALLLGIVLWTFFQEVVKQGLSSVVGNGGMIRKINFPKYIIVIATSLSAVINLVINLVVVAILATISGVHPSFNMFMVPIFVAELYLFGLGLAFFFSAINVKFRDIGYIWDVMTQALFYGSAIMFPLNEVVKTHEQIAILLSASPITQAIQDARYFGITTDVDTGFTITSNIFVLVAPYLVTLITLILGALFFRKRSPYFAEDI